MGILGQVATAVGLWRAADSFSTNYVSPLAPIVLGGCGRSGTTLFRMILDSHRQSALRSGIEHLPPFTGRP